MGQQTRHCYRTHRQLLAYVLYGGLQCPCPLRGLILNSFHCLQQGSDICHHHLWKGKEVKPHISSGLLPAPSRFSAEKLYPHTLLTPPHLVLPPVPPLHAVPHVYVPLLPLLPPGRQRSPPCSFSSPPSHPVQLRPWQSSSAGRQQDHPQLCQQLPWWHRSGLQVPWPHPSQH